MERDSDTAEIVAANGEVILRDVYPAYQLLLAGLYWQCSDNSGWHVERILQWMNDNKRRVYWLKRHLPRRSPSRSKARSLRRKSG